MTGSTFAEGQSRSVASVQRALQVMRMFLESEPGEGISVSETARRLGVAKSTISRLMATLAAEGFVVLDPVSRRYHVGVVAFQIGSRLAVADLAQALVPVVRSVAATTGHTAQLGTLRANKVLYLTVAESSTRLRVVASPGDLRDVHASAMGKALLATMSEPERESVMRALIADDGALPRSGPGTIRDLVRLREELEHIRRQGYSVSREEAAEGVAAVGIRVALSAPEPLAVSVALPNGLLTAYEEARIRDALEAAAREIDRLLTPHATAGTA